jgi:HEAT repeat protein
MKPGLPENRRQIDTDAVALLVPYIVQLAPRLNDPAQATRTFCLLVLGGIAVVRPTPRELLDVLLAALRDPHSTTPLGGAPAGKIGEQSSMGPQILWILLPAGATFSPDPVTHITEGRDSEEVNAAVIQFLQRPDQTPESLSESVRAIGLAQPQNPEVNEQLVKLLQSPSERVQLTMLSNLPRLRLSPQLYQSARLRVTQMAGDPAATAQVRSYAKQLLACWANDRHRACMVPCGPNCVQAQ